MIQVAPGRLRLWAIGLVVVGLVPVLGAPFNSWNDWSAFWSAGALVGSPALLDPSAQAAWQVAHGVPIGYFPYPPAAALIFVPFSWPPLGAGFVAFGFTMLAALAVAGWHGGPLFGLSPRAGLLVALAWAPATASITLGQNAPLGLLLAVVVTIGVTAAEPAASAADASATRRVRGDVVAGVAAGLACYKPTFGLPLVGLLLLRRRWAALGASLATLAVGYVVSALAAGGDFAWPAAWLDALGSYVAIDFAANADKAISIPGLLQHAGLPGAAALAVGVVIVLASLPLLVKAGTRDAVAIACLVGIVASPHAWGYDGALLVPALLLLCGSRATVLVAEPWRTRLVVLVYPPRPAVARLVPDRHQRRGDRRARRVRGGRGELVAPPG